jgi:AmiR/NasT family two-component response regulator
MSINTRIKTLFVCPVKHDDVEQRLKSAGCALIKVNDGMTAVARVRREMFDVAVLVSTGEAMDLMETVFNLKDIRSSMPIIVLCDSRRGPESPAAIPNVRYCSAPELQSVVKAAGPGVIWTETHKQ